MFPSLLLLLRIYKKNNVINNRASKKRRKRRIVWIFWSVYLSILRLLFGWGVRRSIIGFI